MAKGQEPRLTLSGVLAPPLDKAHGVRSDELEDAVRRLSKLSPALLAPDAPSGFLQLPGRRVTARAVRQIAARLRRGVHDVVQVGTGGSSLGAQALVGALAHPQHNLLSRRRRGGPRVHFVDNVDAHSLAALAGSLDPARTVLHVVSKSGTTTETLAAFQWLRGALPTLPARRMVFTTGAGPLRDFAVQAGAPWLDFPQDVGGRFSVLTPSGLLTPALAGVPVGEVMRGARAFALACAKRPVQENPAALAAAAAYLLAERCGKQVQVLMPYSDALQGLSRWFVQLVAESLGKRRAADGRHVGPTPLPARGATDQHAQMQLFMEGPADKLLMFIAVGAAAPQGRRSAGRNAGPGAGSNAGARGLMAGAPAEHLAGLTLHEILEAQRIGAEQALSEAGRPWLRFEMRRLTPAAMGALLMCMQWMTVAQATLLGINAFDQPGVEAGKRAARALLEQAQRRKGPARRRAAGQANR